MHATPLLECDDQDVSGLSSREVSHFRSLDVGFRKVGVNLFVEGSFSWL